MKHPTVVAVERKPIRMMGRRGVRIVQRYYVTLSFGGIEKKLAVSKGTADWLRRA